MLVNIVGWRRKGVRRLDLMIELEREGGREGRGGVQDMN